MDTIKDNGMNVCKNFGVVDCYDLQAPYIDFNENKFKFKRKSLYIRKYHILNIINNIRQKNNIHIDNSDEEKTLKIFYLINKTLLQVNGNRKRMILVKFILTKIFTILQNQIKH